MATFKTRARALDLLGRQQIAGIPTAINELFKNAHDAYADNAQVDYFRGEKLFILRDNGLGMTMLDFESRWLTLGTESKFSNKKIPAPPTDPKKTTRPIMGEKGIGRLAVASIGSQLLVLSRAKRNDTLGKIVAAFISWRLFELPALNLEDVVIPLREFDGDNIPGKSEIKGMKDELVNSIKKLVNQKDIEPEEGKSLIEEISSFDVDPSELHKRFEKDLSLEFGAGTHFFIQPTEETLNHDIDGEKDSNGATKIEKMMVGFTNTMTPNHPEPAIEVGFKDYRSEDGTFFDLLNKEQFFTPEDFELADHHVNGAFDEFGQFRGKIKVYDEEEFDHVINWNGNNYKKTSCGPFSINLAYIQGRQRQSKVDSQNWARIIAKTEKFGGLYIYKDNIRILPYGDSDYDFIDIEKNRTKSASFYFFSYRRIFGVIDITQKSNFKLKEKAGREGFIENKPYRQLQEILKNFFVQLAADFFRDGGGPKSEYFVKKRAEQEQIYKAIEKRQEQAKGRKTKFLNSLNRFFEENSKGKYEKELGEFLEETEKQISSIAYIEDPDEASQKLLDLEYQARQNLSELKRKIKVNQPRGFSISKDAKRDFKAYLDEFEKLNANLFNGAESQIEALVTDYTNRLNIEISKRKRLEQAIEFISTEASKATKKKGVETKQAVSNISSKVKELTSGLMIGLENKIREVKDEFKNLQIQEAEDFDLVAERIRMEELINKEKNHATHILESIIKQLDTIYWEEDEEGKIITSADMTEALEEEIEVLRDRVNSDVELSQLGIAVGIIHHEFNSTINSIRRSIRDLKAWSDVNESLDGIYNNIRINFEHLDGYLTLFTPLNRRLYRTKENIPASDIYIFLKDLFQARLERHNIQLKRTKGFGKSSIFGLRSVFYPVFVILVDNAIHWLNQKFDDEEKVIRLHADSSGFYVSNNGIPIHEKDHQVIFDYGFTRKPTGRGMGLHIAKEVLEGVGYRIFVSSPRKNSTVTFKVEQTNPEEE